MSRVVIRHVPGFVWVQVAIRRPWRWGHWWAVRNVARVHSFGPVWICTMRSRLTPVPAHEERTSR